MARGALEFAEGDSSNISKNQKLNRCRLLENGALKERWNALMSIVAPLLPKGLTVSEWQTMKEDIRRRLCSKFFILYCIDLGQRLNEKNREQKANLPGDGGLRGPLRAVQIAKEAMQTATKKRKRKNENKNKDNV